MKKVYVTNPNMQQQVILQDLGIVIPAGEADRALTPMFSQERLSRSEDLEAAVAAEDLAVRTEGVPSVVSDAYVDVPAIVTRGFNVKYLSPNTVGVYKGLGLSDDAQENIALASELTLDLTTTGMNGLDSGAEESDEWYFIWVIKNPSTGVVAGLLSKSLTNPELPNGFTKKLRVGCVRNHNGNFLRFKHIKYDGKAEYHYFEELASTLRVASGDAATTFSIVDCSALIPPTAHLAHFYIRVVGSTSNYAYIRPTGMDLNYVRRVNGGDTLETQCCVCGSQSLEYRTTNRPTSIYISVLGFIEDLI